MILSITKSTCSEKYHTCLVYFTPVTEYLKYLCRKICNKGIYAVQKLLFNVACSAVGGVR